MAETIDLGGRIKGTRKKKGLTLQELAQRSGVSATAISAIERNVSSPTVNTLAAVAHALGEPLVRLLGEGEVPYVLTRAGQRTKIASGIRNADCESLASGAFGRRFHPFVCTLSPGAESGEDFHARSGDHFFFVVHGSLVVEIAGELLRLEEGDTLYCCADAPRKWRNGADGPTEVLVVSAA